MKTWLKAFTHNCIVHPMMMFVPGRIGDKMHDWNADWAFGEERYDELALEKLIKEIWHPKRVPLKSKKEYSNGN